MTDFKQKLRGFFSDSSLFRRIYIIDLFFTNIAFLQIPAYVLLVFLFIWGVCLSVYNQRHNNTFFKTALRNMDWSISCRNGIFDAHQFFTDISFQPSYASARCNVFFYFFTECTQSLNLITE